MALKSAAATAATITKRREDEAALRDAFALRRPGQDLGPAGRAYAAFRVLADPGHPWRVESLLAVAANLQSPLEPEKAEAIGAAIRPGASRRRAAPVLAASAARIVFSLNPAGEALALWAADAALAAALDWPIATPLIAGALLSPSFIEASRRTRPADSDWPKAAALAYARAALNALDLADELFRGAQRLGAAAPKLRAKGKGRVLTALLDDDAISATHPMPNLSDRAQRRLFERLVELGAARELTGRPTFRLYGL